MASGIDPHGRIGAGAGTTAVHRAALNRAVAAVSTGEWELAISAWHASASTFPNLATAMISDAARRCGRLDIVGTCALPVGEMLKGSVYLSAHQTTVDGIAARRRAADLPASVTASMMGLEPDAVRHFGRKAVDCQMWRPAIEAWSAMLVAQGQDPEALKHLGRSYAALGIHVTARVHLAEAQRLEPDDRTQQLLDRETRLDARAGDPFKRHAQRLVNNDVIAAVRDALADLLGRNIALGLTIAEELRALSDDIGVDLLELPGPYPLPTAATAARVPV